MPLQLRMPVDIRLSPDEYSHLKGKQRWFFESSSR